MFFTGGEVGDLRLKELLWSKTKSLRGDRLLFGPHTMISVANEEQPHSKAQT